MATSMFSALVWKNSSFKKKKYACPSVDSFSGYKYIKNLNNS